MSIGILDYGVGNLGSIANMLKKIGQVARFVTTTDELESVNKIILPGVGAFDDGMQRLKKSGLLPLLEKKVLHEKCPLLGICLGAQMLGLHSEEGQEKGLGWIPMRVVRFNPEQLIRVPHMGWNIVYPEKSLPLFSSEEEIRFYFAHSYHMVCEEKKHSAATTFYGDHFTSVVALENIYGVQFHPEKSHRFGATLLKNFADLSPC